MRNNFVNSANTYCKHIKKVHGYYKVLLTFLHLERTL